MVDRAHDFNNMTVALDGSIVSKSNEHIVAHGDSLELIARIPGNSVNLILTDPPYHSTKKANIQGDRNFEEDEHFLEWMESYAAEWKRVLKLSGTLYVFCSAQMSARLEVMMSKYFRPIAHITWTKPNEPGYDGWKGKMKKDALRTWYPHAERILMFEHGSYGSWEAYRRSPIGEYLLECRKKAGMSMIQLTEVIGAYGKVNRGGAVANWEAGRNIPSREQYEKLAAALEATGKIDAMLPYEDLVRPMNLSKDVEFTDVWDFMSVRPFADKHPAEKPQDMLIHMISASSYPGDIVLDCFCGSGSTGVAARRLGRKTVCIDIDAKWTDRASKEVADAKPGDEFTPVTRVHHAKGKRRTEEPASVIDSLFD
ncbi:DNA-methyltransferase [Rhodococcus pyridinivorans]|uniref:DNA-methyltransferase n=1 Tax=Rhodococcus pyridinivorans TaxID=103816 RepID=UPI0009BF1A6E|nr:site-specific DNA-methyltransferase [Rhodococcus pyridinivorans]